MPRMSNDPKKGIIAAYHLPRITKPVYGILVCSNNKWKVISKFMQNLHVLLQRSLTREPAFIVKFYPGGTRQFLYVWRDNRWENY